MNQYRRAIELNPLAAVVRDLLAELVRERAHIEKAIPYYNFRAIIIRHILV